MKKLEPKIRIECINRDYKHVYKDLDTGIEYPSTTSVTKIIQEDINPLLKWSVNQASQQVTKMLKGKAGKEEIIDEKFIREVEETMKSKPSEAFTKAGDFGTKFHSLVEIFIATGKDPDNIDEELKIVYRNFKDWLNKSKLKIVLGDTPCINRKEGYAGRLDVLFQDENGEYVLGDWKTSNWLNNAGYSMQIASYCAAFSDTYGVPMPNKALVVRFDKNKPMFEVAIIKNVEESYKSFLDIFRIKKQLEKGVWASVNKFYGS